MKISIILDLAILLIAGLTIALSAYKGMLRSIRSILVFAISVLLVILLRVPVANALEKTKLPEKAETGVSSVIDELLKTDNASEEPSSDAQKLMSYLEGIGLDADEYRQIINDKVSSSKDSLRETLTGKIAPRVAELSVQVTAVLLIFFASTIVFNILFALLTRMIRKIDILKKTDRVLGLIIGFFLAAFRVLLFVAAVQTIMNLSFFQGIPFLSELNAGDTYLFRWIAAINPLSFLF